MGQNISYCPFLGHKPCPSDHDSLRSTPFSEEQRQKWTAPNHPSSFKPHALTAWDWCRMQCLLRLLCSLFSKKRKDFSLIKGLDGQYLQISPCPLEGTVSNSSLTVWCQDMLFDLCHPTYTSCFYYHIDTGKWCHVGGGRLGFSSM